MLRIVLLCACVALASSPSSFAREKAADDKEVARAAALIRSWEGDSRVLDEARAILTRELRDNPDSAPALREQARLLMSEGYLIGSKYKPGSLAAASVSLEKAIALAPTDPTGYLLRAGIYTRMERFEDAWAALETARKNGADKRDWSLGQAWLLRRQKRFDEAAVPLRKILNDPQATPDQRHEARNGMIQYWLVGLKPDQADKLYREQLKETPQAAWVHGDYASFLLCWRDDFNGSIAQVRAARRIMDYGRAQAIEAAALFRLWAQQSLDGKAADAEKTWKQTGVAIDANIAPFVSGECGGNRVTQAVLKAMLKTGYGARVPAVAALIMAADAAPEHVPGVFVMTVQASGHSDGDVFLNSETDYRDQRNLSVRIGPKAQEELRKKYGDDFEATLKGQPVEVMGWVARTKISFRANGVDTGRFYYQTHVVIYSADQIQRFIDKPPLDLRPKLDDADVKT